MYGVVGILQGVGRTSLPNTELVASKNALQNCINTEIAYRSIIS